MRVKPRSVSLGVPIRRLHPADVADEAAVAAGMFEIDALLARHRVARVERQRLHDEVLGRLKEARTRVEALQSHMDELEQHQLRRPRDHERTERGSSLRVQARKGQQVLRWPGQL